jgi:hypothetical protein
MLAAYMSRTPMPSSTGRLYLPNARRIDTLSAAAAGNSSLSGVADITSESAADLLWMTHAERRCWHRPFSAGQSHRLRMSKHF